MQVGTVLVGLQDGAELAQRTARSLLQRHLDAVLGRTVLCSNANVPKIVRLASVLSNIIITYIIVMAQCNQIKSWVMNIVVMNSQFVRTSCCCAANVVL